MSCRHWVISSPDGDRKESRNKIGESYDAQADSWRQHLAQEQEGRFERAPNGLTKCKRQRTKFGESNMDGIYGADYQRGRSCLRRLFPVSAEGFIELLCFSEYVWGTVIQDLGENIPKWNRTIF